MEIQDTSEHLTIFSKAVIGVDSALNQVVIKTFAGMAQAVAASIDSMMNHNMLGSIAGDDTVLLILRSEDEAQKTVDKLKRMFGRKEHGNVN